MPALGRLFITPADLNRRVTIRYWSNGELTDVVGILNKWQDHTFTVLNKHGDEIAIPFLDIFAAKVVAPEIGAAWVETSAIKVWRAKETQQLGDWVLQATGGGASRVNSCLMVGFADNAGSIEDSISEIIRWYQERELPPIAQLSTPGIFDQYLIDANFEKTYLIDFLTKPVESKPLANEFKVTTELTADWLMVVNKNNGENRQVDEFTLNSGAFVRFFSHQIDTEIKATARLAIEDGFALVTNLWVDESLRNQGMGQQLMYAVENMAHSLGIDRIWLQVLHSNQPAQALYKKIGYQLHHQYCYWAYSA
jgi:N-acetylglutamate synthase